MSTGSTTHVRTVVLLLVLPLLVGITSWTPAAEAAPRAHRTTVTVALGSPGAATRVVARLQARGFRVLRTTSWSVTASAPRRVVAATFGRHGSTSRARAVLGAGVGGVAPQQPGLLQPMAVTSGTDYRNAYAATPTSGVTHGNTVSGGDHADGTTVATIQFAQFDASDLTRYAASQRLPDPVASGQYSGVLVDGGPTDTDGAIEVALDQQAILATSPTARQRAYFAPNTTSGFADALQQVADDAAAFHITALSISWGNCESKYDQVSRQILDRAFASLLSVDKVTVFSSSGDTGVYGCRTATGAESTVDVTYPASSPDVVAVGGTRLAPVGTSAPNTGPNWTETAWSCTTLATCAKGGSGGGASTAYPRQSWQVGAGVALGTQRLVPDIAAVGDPGSGFVVTQCGTRYLVGGTSLSSPVAAALLTDALSEAGWTSGVGDIHANLYRAASGTLRDVTTGSNGPSSSAGTGYDTVSGLGAVLWPKLVDLYYPSPAANPTTMATAVPTTVTWPLCSTGTTTPVTPTATTPTSAGSTAPGPSARAVLTQARGSRHRARVVARWSVLRSGAALATTRVVVTDLTSGRILARANDSRGARTVVVPAGHRVALAVLPRDVNGAGTLVRVVHRVR